MPLIYWQGTQQNRAQIDRCTVGTAVVAATYTLTLTIGSAPTVTRTATYKAVTGDTVDTIAAALTTAWASSPDPQMSEIAAAVDPNATAQLTFTGPPNGAPFTLAAAASGGAVFSRAADRVPVSGHDAADVVNYVGGALPSNGDTLIFDRGSIGPKFNLAAITGVTLAELIRYPGFTGEWGNPDRNPNGYLEYRPTHFETGAALITLEHADSDSGQQFRVKKSAGATLSVRITGAATPQSELPVVEVYNTPADSTFYVAGASVGIGMQPAADTAGTLQGTNSRVWLGAREVMTTPGTIVLTDCTAFVASGYQTAAFYGPNSDVTVTPGGGAAGASTKLFGGRMTWRSLGTPAAVEVGPNAYYDLTLAPGIVPAHAITLNVGCTVDNRAGRIGSGFTLVYRNCDASSAVYMGPANETHTVT